MPPSRLAAAIRRRLRSPEPAAFAPSPSPWFNVSGLSAADRAIVERALPHTMTGVPRLQALVDAVRYLVRRGVPGAFAECGVWQGGSVLAMVLTLQELGVADRDIHLFDTFEGMTEPTEHDTTPFGGSQLKLWHRARRQGVRMYPEYFSPERFSEEGVRATVLATGYPPEHLHFVAGPVEETLPAHAPKRLALLRLDTDWYVSTRHELEHLYPALAGGGVLIIDDYGHFDGARRATDEYFAAHAAPLLLQRIDYSGRMAVRA